MGVVIRIALYAVAGLLLLGAISFFMRSLSARALAGKQAYGVARQAKRLEMMQASFWGVGLLIFALAFAAVASLGQAGSGGEGGTAEPTADVMALLETVAAMEAIEAETAQPTAETEEQPSPTATPSLTPVPTSAVAPPAIDPTAEASPETAEPPTEETAVAITPIPPTPDPTAAVAYVDSPVVGLYLRVIPGGEIVERLDDRTVVQLLEERQTVSGLEWVRVVAPSGNTGWVAADFLQLGLPPTE